MSVRRPKSVSGKVNEMQMCPESCRIIELVVWTLKSLNCKSETNYQHQAKFSCFNDFWKCIYIHLKSLFVNIKWEYQVGRKWEWSDKFLHLHFLLLCWAWKYDQNWERSSAICPYMGIYIYARTDSAPSFHKIVMLRVWISKSRALNVSRRISAPPTSPSVSMHCSIVEVERFQQNWSHHSPSCV